MSAGSISMNKISFAKRKIDLQVSRKEKPYATSSTNENQH